MELMCQNMEEPSTENCQREHDSLVQFNSDKTRQLSANVKMFLDDHLSQVISYRRFKSIQKRGDERWDVHIHLRLVMSYHFVYPLRDHQIHVWKQHACSKLPQTECNNIWHKLSLKQLRKNDTELITAKSVMINKGIRSVTKLLQKYFVSDLWTFGKKMTIRSNVTSGKSDILEKKMEQKLQNKLQRIRGYKMDRFGELKKNIVYRWKIYWFSLLTILMMMMKKKCAWKI